MLTEAMIKFIELEKKKEEIKQFYKELQAATEAVFKEVGEGGSFQDAEGTVYQMVVPEGKFVNFEKYGYMRTRRSHEKRGDLSLTKAKELGYDV